MGAKKEVEIKFRVDDTKALSRKLRSAGFRQITKRTHEMNTLYDLPAGVLRQRGELLRLRKYGSDWVLTHKGKGKAGRHKSRAECETKLADGRNMQTILQNLGYTPTFRYEKYRAEFSDGEGHVVIDETPIGNLGEIEGPSRWIDRIAKQLGIARQDYITKSYAELFFDWKRQTRSAAEEMTFAAVKAKRSQPR
jgi:adenylate cyclase, class 2